MVAHESGTYVYCLVADRRPPALTRKPSGLTGLGRPRLLEVSQRGPNGLSTWLVVADAPLDRFGEQAINRGLADLDWVARAAVAHEAMIESFSGAPAVLPMKLFTIFTSDVRARDHVRNVRRRIDSLIRRVSHRQEWGVRVVFDAASAPGFASSAAASTDRRTPGRRRPVATERGVSGELSGKSYLRGKKARRDAVAELSRKARDTMSHLYERLAAHASGATRKSPGQLPGERERLLLDAAFLVPMARSARFRRLVTRESRALGREGYRVTLTGPWPPFSFVEA